MNIRLTSMSVLTITLLLSAITALPQEKPPGAEPRVSLTEPATAVDTFGTAALEGKLATTSLNGAPDSPVTNIRLILKNISPISYAYVSGFVTFYENSGTRCGEGLFKADALATTESLETDAPGLRIRCSPSSWRLVATNLVPRSPVLATSPPVSHATLMNFLIVIDGEQYPIQLGKPMVLNIGGKQRTIVVREPQP